MKKIKLKYINWFIGVIVAVQILSRGLVLNPDSIGYIDAQPIRSAGYPLIILFFKMFFGKLALNVLSVFQLFLLVFSIHYFLNFLRDKFKLTDFVVLLLSFVFYFFLYQMGNEISSEPLSLVLYLFSIKFLLESILENKKRSLYFFYALLFLLVLIRAQFYFLYPVIFFVVLFLFYRNRNWKLFFRNIAILLIVIAATNLADKSYHYFKHGRFMGTPYTGLQIVTDALYISKPGDSILFNDTFDRKMFNEVYSNIYEQGLILESLEEQNPSVTMAQIIMHYNDSYNEICHRNTKVIIGSKFDNPGSIIYWENIDKATLNISKKIILRHPVEFLKLYVYDILRNGFISNIFFVFFVITFLHSLVVLIIYPKNKVYFFLVLSSLILLSNFFLVALVEPILDRYSIYGYIVYFVSLFILISNGHFFNEKKDTENSLLKEKKVKN